MTEKLQLLIQRVNIHEHKNKQSTLHNLKAYHLITFHVFNEKQPPDNINLILTEKKS